MLRGGFRLENDWQASSFGASKLCTYAVEVKVSIAYRIVLFPAVGIEPISHMLTEQISECQPACIKGVSFWFRLYPIEWLTAQGANRLR